jgi:hypothetical protein
MRRGLLACLTILSLAWAYWIFGSTKSEPSYPRVQYWIEAAQCAQATGHFMVVCDSKTHKETPIEDVSLADDPGHLLILSTLARVFNFNPTTDLLRSLNITLGFFGFGLFTLLIGLSIGWRAAILISVLGAYWMGGRAGPDVDASYIGAAMLSASAILLVSAGKLRPVSLISVFFLLSLVTFLRQPIGLCAALTIILIALARLKRSQFIAPIILVIAALAAVKTPLIPSIIRDHVLGMKATGTSGHGIAHNLFLGLGGYVDNKWGIVWDDAYAQALMKKLHPEIVYCSDAYFREIGKLYVQYITSDPAEATRIYLIKTARVFNAPTDFIALPSFMSILLLIALIWWARRRKIKLSTDVWMTISGLAIFAFSFLAQGILTHPAWTYIYPGPILFMIVVVVLGETVRRGQKRLFEGQI